MNGPIGARIAPEQVGVVMGLLSTMPQGPERVALGLVVEYAEELSMEAAYLEWKVGELQDEGEIACWQSRAARACAWRP